MDNKCVSKEYLGFELVLDVEPQLFYPHMNHFKDEIIGLSGVSASRSQISIKTIRSGSTFIDGSLNADSAAQVAAMQNSVSSGTTTGDSLADFSVISSSISAVTLQ